MPNNSYAELAAALGNTQGGYGEVFDPGMPSGQFSIGAYLSRFGLAGQLAGQGLDAGMHKYMPQFAGMGMLRGRSHGQFAVDMARQNAFAQMQGTAQAAIGQHYASALGQLGVPPELQGQLGGMIAQSSHLAGSLMYGGGMSDAAMQNLFHAGANAQNRFSPTGDTASTMFDAFTSYYGVMSTGPRNDVARGRTFGLNNVDLSKVWRDLAQVQMQGGGFEARGERVFGIALGQLAASGQIRAGVDQKGLTDDERKVLQGKLTSMGFDISLAELGGRSGLMALGAQDAGVAQYSNVYKTLRDVGGATSGPGEMLESISSIFGVAKFDKHAVSKAANDMAEIAAATGETFEELKGLFETVSSMKGVGLTTKLGAARSYAVALGGIKGGASALSAREQAELFGLTTGVSMNIRGSQLSVLSDVFAEQFGGAGDLTPDKFYNLMGASLDTLREKGGEHTAGMLSALRRGDLETFNQIATARSQYMEASIAAANASKDPKEIARVKAEFGARVEVSGGELRKTDAGLTAALTASRDQLTRNTGKSQIVNASLQSQIEAGLGVGSLTRDRLEAVVSVFGKRDSAGNLLPENSIRAALGPALTEEQAKRLNISSVDLARLSALIPSYLSSEFGNGSRNAMATADAAYELVTSNDPKNRKILSDAAEEARKRGKKDVSDALVGGLRGLLNKDPSQRTAEDWQKAVQGIFGSGGIISADNQQLLESSLAGMKEGDLAAFIAGAQTISDARAAISGLDPADTAYAKRREDLEGVISEAQGKLKVLNPTAASFLNKSQEVGASKAGQRVAPSAPQAVRMEGRLTIVNGQGIVDGILNNLLPGGAPAPTGK